MGPKKQKIQPSSSSTASSLYPAENSLDNKINALSNYINDIIINAEENKEPNIESDNRAEILINQITSAVESARTRGQVARLAMQEQAQKAELSGMEMEERNSTTVQIGEFMNRFQNIINGSTSLTYGQRARLFSALLRSVDQIITEEQSEIAREPDHLNRLREIWSILVEQFGILVSDMRRESPDIARNGAAILSASLMSYTYLPEGMRLGVQSLPVLGSLFRLTELARPYTIEAQSSVAAVTMIYYFLRNSGIDTTGLIGDIGSFTRECAGIAANQTCSFIASSSRTIFNYVSTGLSEILLPPDLESMNLSVDTASTSENSQTTQASVRSIQHLLNNNDVQVDMPQPPPIEVAEVVVEQDIPLAINIEGSQSSSSQLTDIDLVDITGKRPRSENNSQSSSLQSFSSQESLLGGIRKNKKSMRRVKSRRTRKNRKNRVQHRKSKTSKARRNRSTLKRYKARR